MQDSASIFLTYGYLKEAIPVLKEHAQLLVRLARESTARAEKHDFYTQAVNLMGQAKLVCEQIYTDIHGANPIQEVSANA